MQTPKKSIGAWLMGMEKVAQNIPQWQVVSWRDSEDDPSPGRTTDVISQEMIDHVERHVLNKVAEVVPNEVFLMEVFTL